MDYKEGIGINNDEDLERSAEMVYKEGIDINNDAKVDVTTKNHAAIDNTPFSKRNAMEEKFNLGVTNTESKAVLEKEADQLVAPNDDDNFVYDANTERNKTDKTLGIADEETSMESDNNNNDIILPKSNAIVTSTQNDSIATTNEIKVQYKEIKIVSAKFEVLFIDDDCQTIKAKHEDVRKIAASAKNVTENIFDDQNVISDNIRLISDKCDKNAHKEAGLNENLISDNESLKSNTCGKVSNKKSELNGEEVFSEYTDISDQWGDRRFESVETTAIHEGDSKTHSRQSYPSWLSGDNSVTDIDEDTGEDSQTDASSVYSSQSCDSITEDISDTDSEYTDISDDDSDSTVAGEYTIKDVIEYLSDDSNGDSITE